MCKKSIAVLLITLAIVTMLGACAPKVEPTKAPPPTKAPEAPTEPAAATPGGKVLSGLGQLPDG